jgi:hypothetical protein
MTFHDNPQRVPKPSVVPPPVSVLMISSTALLKTLVDTGAVAHCSHLVAGTQNPTKQTLQTS